jgi:diguanylate cyclase (GGDEF)-like protein/PAS domain S-box-containing protein
MREPSKAKQTLVNELESLKQRIQELEHAESDRKRAEEALKASEERFRTLSDKTPLGMCLIDSDGRYEYVNPAFVKIFGYDLSDIPTGKEWFRTAYPDPEYRREVMADWKEDLSSYPNLEIKPRIYEVRCKGGDFRTIIFRPVTLPSEKQLIIYEDITDRKRAEEVMQEEKTLSESIINSLPGIFYLFDAQGKFLRWNRNFEIVSGYSHKEMLERHPSDFFAGKEKELVQERIRDTFVNGEANVEARFISRNGAGAPYFLTGARIEINGQPHVMGLGVDISDRKRAEQEIAILVEIRWLISSTLDIEEVYERFAVEVRKLIPFDRITINLNNHDQNTITVAYASGSNVPGRRLGDSFPLQGSINEALARTKTGMLLHPTSADELTRLYPHLVSTFQKGISSFMSVPLIYRDELIGVLHFRAKKPNAYTEQDLQLAERIGGQIAGAIANAQLYTGLKKTEMSLRESEGRFRALVEQAAVGVAEIVMETGQFITVNRRLCEMVGRSEGEMLATTFHAITHPEDLHLHEEKTVLLLAGKIGHYNLEKRYLRKDGEIVWVNIEVSPLWKPGEKPGRNMIVVEDITERKRMEAEMREMSLRDLLTDLYNRRGFITLAEQQLKAANRAQRPLQLTFIDCDGLKGINDTFGHEEGDRALIDTANVLRQTFRESDIIARLGGDEFAVLSIDAADMNPEDFSKRLQENIDVGNAKGTRPYTLAMSWGTAVYDPGSPLSLDELMFSADKRMYAQKMGKSNRRN